MAKDKTKSAILSSELDFENVDGSPIKDMDIDLSHLQFDLPSDKTDPATFLSKPVAEKPPIRPQSAASPTKKTTILSAGKKTAGKNSKISDRITLYAAVIALCGFLIIFGSIFYFKVLGSDETVPSYLVLPRAVIHPDGQVVRIQLTLQVESKDREWLGSNKKALSDILPIVLMNVDPEDLHSEKGFEHLREQLRQEFNQRMGTNKINAVLVNELLSQSH
ncbi:flagellar basal body-associated FliL family protein [Undibacterium oligocarboniphilum]|uniref:Flagellar protein FliL n=1 Tax=Undibacterium oligocarboniphilum TaxID=666702 RepID=A0A850QRU9_9BURK|nr:flagellar basal body-associated FliL family protein [Undibacterium oligocarboniphilum]MBC3871537.1 flagellar basal body-associated FliL family protein [Undibacterium oligocarboniphilum]NVO79104.1 flagellar basal body-associated FliL family protein [Undibacterium oligocarboniphilum]